MIGFEWVAESRARGGDLRDDPALKPSQCSEAIYLSPNKYCIKLAFSIEICEESC